MGQRVRFAFMNPYRPSVEWIPSPSRTRLPRERGCRAPSSVAGLHDPDPLCCIDRLLVTATIKHDNEFLAPIASEYVGISYGSFETLTHLPETFIPRVVAIAVVIGFKVIDVGEKHGYMSNIGVC